MRKPLAVVIALVFAACSAPTLPPPPSEAQRAAWRTVAIEVLPPPPFAIEAPPTTFLGRVAVGGERGLLLGGAIGGSPANPAGLLGMAVLGIVGGGVGVLVGPFCGASTEDVEATTARLATTAAATPAHERLAADLRREFTLRGVRVAADAPVRCEVRVHDLALRGANDFDPELALVAHGVLRVRGNDAIPQYELPFRWQGPPRRYGAWGDRPRELARALDESSARLATFLADELWCTVDADWGGRS